MFIQTLPALVVYSDMRRYFFRQYLPSRKHAKVVVVWSITDIIKADICIPIFDLQKLVMSLLNYFELPYLLNKYGLAMSALCRLGKTRKFLLCALFCLLLSSGFSQKLEVLYAQFDGGIDTTTFLPSPFYPNPDTLAKWIFLYADGKSLIKQTEDTPYEKKSYLVNKATGNLDNIIRYNMGKNDIFYNNYVKYETRSITHFFDIRYVIDDKLPRFEWKVLEGEKTILNYHCKLARARYPIDKNLLFEVW